MSPKKLKYDEEGKRFSPLPLINSNNETKYEEKKFYVQKREMERNIIR